MLRELKTNQRADWPQLDPSMLLSESPQSKALSYLSHAFDSAHFLGRRMESAWSQSAPRYVLLSGLFHRQETSGFPRPTPMDYSGFTSIFTLNLASFIPRINKQTKLVSTTSVSGQSWHWESLEEKKEVKKGLTFPEYSLFDRHQVSHFIGEEMRLDEVKYLKYLRLKSRLYPFH